MNLKPPQPRMRRSDPIRHRGRCYPIRFGAVPEPVTARPAICLNMIIKNQADIVHQLLDACAPHISSGVIVDTGSTDGAQHLIKNVLPPLSRRLPNQV